MAKNKSMYKIDFSIDNMSLHEQQHLFEVILSQLDYNQRMDLHVTVTDFLGGKHFIWDGTGKDPDGISCPKCERIECENCQLYLRRQKNKEEDS